MTELYVPEHWSQYDPGCSAVTHHTGCTWTTGATGVDAISGGSKRPTPDQIHALVKPFEESNPAYPGWSMHDLALAMSRYGVSLVDRSGTGWSAVVAALETGHYVALQGDSDQFGNATCSGAYDGNHCAGVHPNHKTEAGERWWWVNDPICPAGRWERESVLKRYAVKLWSSILFGVFSQPVPAVEPKPVNPTPGKGDTNVTIRYATAVTSTTRMRLAKGQRLYASPGGRAVTAMSRTAPVPHIGLAAPGWRAVLIGTAAGYPDGQSHKTVLYVPAAAGEVTKA